MSAATPDTPETRRALALPTREAAAGLGIHPGSVRRLRKRLGVVPPTEAPMVVLMLRVHADLREAVKQEAKRRGLSMGELARAWVASAFGASTAEPVGRAPQRDGDSPQR